MSGWHKIPQSPEKIQKQYETGTGVIEYAKHLDTYFAQWITIASMVTLGAYRNLESAKASCDRKGGVREITTREVFSIYLKEQKDFVKRTSKSDDWEGLIEANAKIEAIEELKRRLGI